MDENIQKKLHELFVQYSKNLPEKIHTIELQWHSLLQHWDLNLFQDFHRDVHSLCGSSGTYGYPVLSKTARKMEILLKNILVDGRLTEEDQKKITHFFSQFKGILAHETPKFR